MIGWMRSPGAEATSSEAGSVVRPSSPESFFLSRLYRLIELRARPNLDPVQRRLVNRTLYSTYWDCVSLGIQTKAATILGLPPQQHSTMT